MYKNYGKLYIKFIKIYKDYEKYIKIIVGKYRNHETL